MAPAFREINESLIYPRVNSMPVSTYGIIQG